MCAEYCGRQHALMGFVAVAHEDDDFRMVCRAEWRLVSAGLDITPVGSYPDQGRGFGASTVTRTGAALTQIPVSSPEETIHAVRVCCLPSCRRD